MGHTQGKRCAGVLGQASALMAVVVGLTGCQSVSMPTTARVDIPEVVVPKPYATVRAGNSSGSIFQAAQYRPLFEDHRARLVGDILTVQIVEKVSASAKSTSTIEKKGAISGSVGAVPLLPKSMLGKLSVSGDSANTFSGTGGTQNSNDFSGVVTATVVEVLPNGHLIVQGEKQIGVNDNVDVLRFSGQVDPHSIQPGNTVSSAEMANVRVEQKGRGGQADAQQVGWLSRFFLSLMPI